MTLNDLEQNVFAFFLARLAKDVNVAGRFFPRVDFQNIFEDRIRTAIRPYGAKVQKASAHVASEIIDMLIEKEALTVKKDKFGGVMHQFQLDPYRKVIGELRDANPIVQKAEAAGEGFWEETFAAFSS